MFNKLSITYRLMIMTVVGSAMVLLVVSLYWQHTAKNITEKEIQKELESTGVYVSHLVALYPILANRTSDLISDSFSNFYGEHDRLVRFLTSSLQNSDEIVSIRVAIDPSVSDRKLRDLECIVERDKSADSMPEYEKADWYLLPKELGKSLWTEPYTVFSSGTANRYVTYSTPLYRDGDFVGVLAVSISLEWLTDRLAKDSPGGGYMLITTSDGVIVSHPDKNLIMNETIFGLAMDRDDKELWKIAKAMQDKKTAVKVVTLVDDEKSIIFYCPVYGINWSVCVIVPYSFVTERLSEYNMTAVTIGGVGINLLMLMSFFISRTITRPLRRLSSAAAAITQKGLYEEVPLIPGSDEVAQLSNTLVTMQKYIRSYIKKEKENAAAQERISNELNIAREIQQGFVPKSFPGRDEGFDLFATLEPALEVGGDSYDFFTVDPNHMLISVCDVSGKGIPAAIFMSAVRTMLRAFAAPGRGPAEMMELMNDEIAGSNDACMFVTVFIAIIDLRDGSYVYASGGHTPSVLIMGDDIRFMERPQGALIGPMPGVKYAEIRGVLAPGEGIFAYTDGVTEAMDDKGELFGEGKMLAALHSAQHMESFDIIASMLICIAEFSGCEPQFDDITMLCFRYCPNPSPED